MQLTSLLSPKDATLVLVDPQPGLAFAVESAPRETLRQNLIALAKTAVVFDLPIVVTTSASKRTLAGTPTGAFFRRYYR